LIKQLDDLNCTCSSSFSEKLKAHNLISQIEEQGHIPPFPKKSKMTGKGDCGIRLRPVA